MASNSNLSVSSSSNSSDTASVLGAPKAPPRSGLRYTNYLGQVGHGSTQLILIVMILVLILYSELKKRYQKYEAKRNQLVILGLLSVLVIAGISSVGVVTNQKEIALCGWMMTVSILMYVITAVQVLRAGTLVFLKTHTIKIVRQALVGFAIFYGIMSIISVIYVISIFTTERSQIAEFWREWFALTLGGIVWALCIVVCLHLSIKIQRIREIWVLNRDVKKRRMYDNLQRKMILEWFVPMITVLAYLLMTPFENYPVGVHLVGGLRLLIISIAGFDYFYYLYGNIKRKEKARTQSLVIWVTEPVSITSPSWATMDAVPGQVPSAPIFDGDQIE